MPTEPADTGRDAMLDYRGAATTSDSTPSCANAESGEGIRRGRAPQRMAKGQRRLSGIHMPAHETDGLTRTLPRASSSSDAVAGGWGPSRWLHAMPHPA